MYILTILYLIIGFMCASHWFEEDYEEEYYQLKIKGEVEEGMVNLLMLGLILFWPFVFAYKFYKAF
jgi:hypothetical protein